MSQGKETVLTFAEGSDTCKYKGAVVCTLDLSGPIKKAEAEIDEISAEMDMLTKVAAINARQQAKNLRG